jgi:hypothetical protein
MFNHACFGTQKLNRKQSCDPVAAASFTFWEMEVQNIRCRSHDTLINSTFFSMAIEKISPGISK